MAPPTKTKARLEARIDPELDQLIVDAAGLLHMSKTAFVSEAVRDAALKVIARSDVTLMKADLFDTLMASLEVPEESAELEALVSQPRQIEW